MNTLLDIAAEYVQAKQDAHHAELFEMEPDVDLAAIQARWDAKLAEVIAASR